MKKSLLFVRGVLCLLAVLFSIHAHAQTAVQGTVKDETGTAIPGATILVKGTSNGIATGPGGNFSIRASSGSVISISAIGFEAKELTLTNQTQLNIVLRSTSNALQQVVVIGYGTAKKKDLTGAITTVNAQEIAGRRTVQVSDALEGAIAGVTVTRNGGAPGATSNIRFRGITTIGTNDPLIIIDGVPALSIDNVNPDDVESITALKDAASTAIYGSRAAAGVILVTTKRGKVGQASINYNYEYGSIRPTSLPQFTGVVRYMQFINEYLQNDASAPLYSQATIDSYMANNAANPDKFPNTNWQADLFESSAARQIHSLSFTAGSEKIKTRASLGYSNTQGLYENLSFKKYNANVNNDFRFNDKLSATFDIAGVKTVNNGVNGNIIADSRILPPIYGSLYQDGRLAYGKDGRNPLAQIREGGYNRSDMNSINGRATVSYKPITGLTVTGIASPGFVFTRNSTFSKVIRFTDAADPTKYLPATNQANTTLTEGRPYIYTFNGQLLANYIKTFSEVHNFEALLGYEDNYNYTESLLASRGSFALTNYPYLSDGLLSLRGNEGGAAETALRSYFSRVSYNYKNKYYLQAGGRLDGSSRFGPDYRTAFYPSFSGGWSISEEDFFKKGKTVNFLKLRGSWGQSGNERIGNYPYQANITLNNALFYNGGVVNPLSSGGQAAYAVSDITWETQQTANIGLDAAFFDSRLSVTADAYSKQTKNILLQLNIPIYLGYDAPYQNAGKVSSKGWEFTTNWADKIGSDWKYNIGFNISDAKTRIDDLKGTSLLGDQANIEGQEYLSWFGYKSKGLFQTAAEVSSSPLLTATTKPGDVRYEDINGDGRISADKDKVALGGSLPRYTFGITGRVAYKGFDFSFAANGVAKQLVRLNGIAVQPFLEGFGNVPTIIDGHYWSASNTPEQNLAAKYPRLSKISESNNYQLSDFWLINGRYLRIKNITVGYSISDKLLQRFGVQGIHVYAACNDPFTFSKFPKGSDPEVDPTSYPIVKTFFAGINVKF